MWEDVSPAEKERIRFNPDQQGTFWMSFKDWSIYFFDLTICLLPSMCPDTGRFNSQDYFLEEIRGTFTSANAPLYLTGDWEETDDRKVHFTLETTKKFVFLQLLADLQRTKEAYFYQMQLYQDNTEINPVMPLSREIVRNRKTKEATGKNVEQYSQAGHFYILSPGKYRGTVVFGRKTEKLDFKVA